MSHHRKLHVRGLESSSKASGVPALLNVNIHLFIYVQSLFLDSSFNFTLFACPSLCSKQTILFKSSQKPFMNKGSKDRNKGNAIIQQPNC